MMPLNFAVSRTLPKQKSISLMWMLHCILEVLKWVQFGCILLCSWS